MTAQQVSGRADGVGYLVAAQVVMDQSAYRIWPADAKANIAAGIAAAVQAEREACAKVLDDLYNAAVHSDTEAFAYRDGSAAIRIRTPEPAVTGADPWEGEPADGPSEQRLRDQRTPELGQ